MKKAKKIIPNKGEYPFLFHYFFYSGERDGRHYMLVYAKNFKAARAKLIKHFREDEIYYFPGPFDSPGAGSSTLL